jgi:hypothetical protein
VSDEPVRSYTVPICPDPTQHGAPVPTVETYLRVVVRQAEDDLRTAARAVIADSTPINDPVLGRFAIAVSRPAFDALREALEPPVT